MSVKKILALLLAAMMVFGMTSAMAAVPGDDAGTTGVNTTSDSTLNIPKSVVVSNEDKTGTQVAGKTIYYPTMVFTYTVAGDDTCETVDDTTGAITYGKTVTDSDGDKTTVYKGVDGGITIASPVTIPEGSVVMNDNGQQVVTGNLAVTINKNEFPHYGIYRYVITDTTPDANLTGKGIVRGTDFDATYYLDIYIKAGTTDTDGDGIMDNEIGGTVLLSDTTETITPSNTTDKQSGIDDVTVTTTTTEVPDDPDDPTGPSHTETTTTLDPTATVDETTNDMYYTYNVTLKKTVDGAMGDKSHEFPFAIAVTGNLVSYTVEEPTASGTPTSKKDQAVVTLKHNEEAVIIGLNALASINYTETNDTASTYKVSAKDKANANLISEDNGSGGTNNYKSVNANGTQAAYSDAQALISGYSKNAQGSITNVAAITFNNNLDDVSPTGVVLRFAPFLAMFAAGCVLFLILATKRSKKEEE